LVPGLVLIHLIVAPYTKVEESFNIQAAHDVLVYGTPTSDIYYKLSSNYDHFTFPGAVPRTFIGPVLLAGISQPIIALVGFQHAQFVVRAVLGLFNATCLLVFSRNLRQAYGASVARWYLVLQASQFHVIFYASRTLPNMFAFGLSECLHSPLSQDINRLKQDKQRWPSPSSFLIPPDPNPRAPASASP
jgi:alpha-1,6-mannosyltransferase